jgi:hypothetical protein
MGTLGTLICGWLAYQRLLGYESIANRPLLLLGIMMILGGLQLLSTGLMAEMLSRTYHESQDKPTYVVREVRESAPGRTREVIGA